MNYVSIAKGGGSRVHQEFITFEKMDLVYISGKEESIDCMHQRQVTHPGTLILLKGTF